MKPNNYFHISLSFNNSVPTHQMKTSMQRCDHQFSPVKPVYMSPRKSVQQVYSHTHTHTQTGTQKRPQLCQQMIFTTSTLQNNLEITD